MQHSWDGYTKYAWGFDELLPLSQTGEDSFCGTGATIIDALDTLWCYFSPLQNEHCLCIIAPHANASVCHIRVACTVNLGQRTVQDYGHGGRF